jgi:selenocysteine lyase/cysteine desulfurase
MVAAWSNASRMGDAAADEPGWQALRRLFPLLERARYVAACSQAPLCTRVEAAVDRFMDSWRLQGNPWETEWIPSVARTAEKFARLVGAPPGSVGVNASVSAALGAVLSALDFRHRPQVIVSALDFPTLPDILLAYRQKGSIELVVLPERGGEIPLESYESAVDERTALVCISSASYATGAQLPIQAVAELCRARGALCLIDAFQTVGALAVDIGQLRPDFLITGTLKYLLGCMGVGLIYVAPEVAERLEPRNIGWMAAANPFGTTFDRLEYAPGAARFQGGTFSIPGCYAAEAALDLLLEIGAPAVEQRVLRLSRRFADGLADLCVRPAGPTGVGKLGPMVAVPVHGDAHEWQERLRREESVITAARGSSLRFAFHFYNNDDDVDACLEVVRRRLRASG